MSSPKKTIDCADDNQIQIIEKLKEYTILQEAFKELIKGETDLIANAANMSALIYQTLSDVNWAGFYFLKGDELVLGPFQGKPACVRIALGKGVCGTAAQERKTIVVPDVSKFPGHIGCDTNSNSEIVVPLIKDNQLFGVLDIDSPKLNRFDAQDQCCLEGLMGMFVEKIALP
jgi:L-methionine (R)-S-oxide reductase